MKGEAGCAPCWWQAILKSSVRLSKVYKKGKIVHQAQTTIPKDIMVSGSSELFDQSLRRLSQKEAYTTKHRNSRFEIQSFLKKTLNQLYP